MLRLKVKKKLLENQFSGKVPANMTQLAAAVGISPKHLYFLLDHGRPQDIDRIAKGLGISKDQLSP